MVNVTHEQLEQHIKVAYETKTPLFTWGGVGIGKSETIKRVAENIATSKGLEITEESNDKEKFGFIDVRISQLEPSDLRGLPIQDIKEGTTKWLFPNWLPRDKDSQGIIFFDELNLSPPSIQAVAYQLILDRRIGDYVLPQGWVIVSAGNRMEDKCNVFDMSSALCNRFIHVELDIPSVEDWSDWAIKNKVDGKIIAFLNFKSDSLYKIGDKNKDKAFPTPRSWVFCNRLINGKKQSKQVEQLISASVGEGTAKEFVAFLRLQTKIDVENIFKNPKQVKKIEDVDLKYVLIGTIAERYRADKKLFEKILPLCDYMEAEYSILLLRFLKNTDERHFKRTITASKKGVELLKSYSDILS